MTLEQQYRDTVDRLTEDVPVGPDLADVIAGGRRRRRARRTAWLGAGTAVAVASVSLVAVVAHRAAPVTQADGPSYHDFVAGTEIDESLQATVARHLPDLPAADDVYPSDWNTSGSIPGSAYANATEWHAVYQVSGSEQLSVVMSQPIPGQPPYTGCAHLAQSDIPCHRDVLPDGSVETRSGYLLGSTTYRFMTVRVTRDGFVIETLDDVRAGSVLEARAERQVTDAATAALVQDPAMTFPAPVDPPASPSPQL